MKAIKQYFHVVLFPTRYKGVLTFKSVDEIQLLSNYKRFNNLPTVKYHSAHRNRSVGTHSSKASEAFWFKAIFN